MITHLHVHMLLGICEFNMKDLSYKPMPNIYYIFTLCEWYILSMCMTWWTGCHLKLNHWHPYPDGIWVKLCSLVAETGSHASVIGRPGDTTYIRYLLHTVN